MTKLKKRTAIFLSLIILLSLSLSVGAADTVKLGGMPFGIRFNVGKLTIGGFINISAGEKVICPAKAAGAMEGDTIVKINGNNTTTAEKFIDEIKNSNGEAVTILIERSGKKKEITVTPYKDEVSGEYKIGIALRDGTAGIGTVTYIIEETGAFGGLGHSICDAHSGEVCKIKRGAVFNVTVTDIKRGIQGEPGEIHGLFSALKCGNIIANTESGVYGVLCDAPDTKTAEIGKFKAGECTILSTLDSGGIKEYTAKIENKPDGSKDAFTVKITDPELIERTGGIVQGMSGSPILQNGKIVGAVTHVLISDPTCGYGITIEKMLENMPEKLKQR